MTATQRQKDASKTECKCVVCMLIFLSIAFTISILLVIALHYKYNESSSSDKELRDPIRSDPMTKESKLDDITTVSELEGSEGFDQSMEVNEPWSRQKEKTAKLLRSYKRILTHPVEMEKLVVVTPSSSFNLHREISRKLLKKLKELIASDKIYSINYSTELDELNQTSIRKMIIKLIERLGKKIDDSKGKPPSAGSGGWTTPRMQNGVKHSVKRSNHRLKLVDRDSKANDNSERSYLTWRTGRRLLQLTQGNLDVNVEQNINRSLDVPDFSSVLKTKITLEHQTQDQIEAQESIKVDDEYQTLSSEKMKQQSKELSPHANTNSFSEQQEHRKTSLYTSYESNDTPSYVTTKTDNLVNSLDLHLLRATDGVSPTSTTSYEEISRHDHLNTTGNYITKESNPTEKLSSNKFPVYTQTTLQPFRGKYRTNSAEQERNRIRTKHSRFNSKPTRVFYNKKVAVNSDLYEPKMVQSSRNSTGIYNQSHDERNMYGGHWGEDVISDKDIENRLGFVKKELDQSVEDWLYDNKDADEVTVLPEETDNGWRDVMAHNNNLYGKGGLHRSNGRFNTEEYHHDYSWQQELSTNVLCNNQQYEQESDQPRRVYAQRKKVYKHRKGELPRININKNLFHSSGTVSTEPHSEYKYNYSYTSDMTSGPEEEAVLRRKPNKYRGMVRPGQRNHTDFHLLKGISHQQLHRLIESMLKSRGEDPAKSHGEATDDLTIEEELNAAHQTEKPTDTQLDNEASQEQYLSSRNKEHKFDPDLFAKLGYWPYKHIDGDARQLYYALWLQKHPTKYNGNDLTRKLTGDDIRDFIAEKAHRHKKINYFVKENPMNRSIMRAGHERGKVRQAGKSSKHGVDSFSERITIQQGDKRNLAYRSQENSKDDIDRLDKRSKTHHVSKKEEYSQHDEPRVRDSKFDMHKMNKSEFPYTSSSLIPAFYQKTTFQKPSGRDEVQANYLKAPVTNKGSVKSQSRLSYKFHMGERPSGSYLLRGGNGRDRIAAFNLSHTVYRKIDDNQKDVGGNSSSLTYQGNSLKKSPKPKSKLPQLLDVLGKNLSNYNKTKTTSIQPSNSEEIDKWIDQILALADDREVLATAIDMYAESTPQDTPRNKQLGTSYDTIARLLHKKHYPTVHIQRPHVYIEYKRAEPVKNMSLNLNSSEELSTEDTNTTAVLSELDNYHAGLKTEILQYILNNRSAKTNQEVRAPEQSADEKSMVERLIAEKVPANWLIIAVSITFSTTCLCTLCVCVSLMLMNRRKFNHGDWWNSNSQGCNYSLLKDPNSNRRTLKSLLSLNGDELRSRLSRMVHGGDSSTHSSSSEISQ